MAGKFVQIITWGPYSMLKWNCIGGKIVWFKEKIVEDVYPSARLFDAETGHFNPTRMGSGQFHQIVVELSAIGGAKLRQFRLNLSKLSCCAGQ